MSELTAKPFFKQPINEAALCSNPPEPRNFKRLRSTERKKVLNPCINNNEVILNYYCNLCHYYIVDNIKRRPPRIERHTQDL